MFAAKGFDLKIDEMYEINEFLIEDICCEGFRTWTWTTYYLDPQWRQVDGEKELKESSTLSQVP